MIITDLKIKNLVCEIFEKKTSLDIEGFYKETPDYKFVKLYLEGNKKMIYDNHPYFQEIANYIKDYQEKYPEPSLNNLMSRITPEIKEEMESIWFIADLHHSHPSIVKHCNRPISIEKHDKWLETEVWNKYISRKDRVYVLGDFSMAPKSEAEKFISKLNGSKTLILGNHDKNLKHARGFIQIVERKEFKFKRQGIDIFIVLDHYPMYSWNRSIHGTWSLYGHVHGRFNHPGLSIDVGIDSGDYKDKYKPINLFEICEIMTNKSYLSMNI